MNETREKKTGSHNCYFRKKGGKVWITNRRKTGRNRELGTKENEKWEERRKEMVNREY